ncbi:hypothetical protein CLI64_11135 [Nostoc sp. CENA543]|nr:hypothetical protein CLI64_11135 [Nostoc sp. CENA543]
MKCRQAGLIEVGDRAKKAYLDEETVRKIKTYREAGMTHNQLAERFSVSKQTIRKVLEGTS